MHYQQKRGLQQTGQVDRDLLEQLRQDPAPKVAVRSSPRRATRTYVASSDPLEPLRVASYHLSHWLQSLTR